MKYRKKPVVIEAVRVTDEWFDAPHPNPLHITGVVNNPLNRTVEIPTLEGTMTARVGDWIITGVKGERYPCKPDIFEATYALVAATPDPDIAAYRFAVTFLVLLPDGWYEKSLSMRMPPKGLTFNFGWYTIEADSVEYDEETDSCLIMDDPALYDPDQEGEAEALAEHEALGGAHA
jgi:hypothetical protein